MTLFVFKVKGDVVEKIGVDSDASSMELFWSLSLPLSLSIGKLYSLRSGCRSCCNEVSDLGDGGIISNH